ncbi:MAG: fibronectin type III domain-containing protein, partial [Flavobacteriales bacterium]
LGFSRLTTAEKLLKSRTIVANMTGNTNFPEIPPAIDLAVITESTNDLEKAAQEAAKGGTDKTLIKNVAEDRLNDLMSQLADYVQMASAGDPVIIESSGMDVRNTATPPQLLGAVTDPTAKVAGNPGEINVGWNKLTGAKSYVVEMLVTIKDGTVIDPLPDPGGKGDVITEAEKGAEWMRIDTVTKSKLLVQGLQTGIVYSFRVAGINGAGQGDYSQIVTSVAP